MDPTIAKNWRSEAVTPHHWEPDVADSAKPNQRGGTGAILVICTETGHRAWMKPSTTEQDNPYSPAKEKIAADLAHDLSLPVPPVLLFRRPPLEEGGVHLPVCLSLESYPRHADLSAVVNVGQKDGGMTPDAPADVKGRFGGSGFIAFDAWLDNDDRDIGENIILGYELDQTQAKELMYIDCANNLMWHHDDCDLRIFRQVKVLPFLETLFEPDAARRVAEQIRDLPDEAVAEIVNRIPDDFLDDQTRNLIRMWLLSRKKTLCCEFAAWYPFK
jgi:hypothetical protein